MLLLPNDSVVNWKSTICSPGFLLPFLFIDALLFILPDLCLRLDLRIWRDPVLEREDLLRLKIAEAPLAEKAKLSSALWRLSSLYLRSLFYSPEAENAKLSLIPLLWLAAFQKTLLWPGFHELLDRAKMSSSPSTLTVGSRFITCGSGFVV